MTTPPSNSQNVESVSEVEAFSKHLRRLFAEAEAAAGGAEEFFFEISNLTLCLKFAGSALVDRITPALRHLQVAPCEEPTFTVCLWDSASTGTAPPWTSRHQVDNESPPDLWRFLADRTSMIQSVNGVLSFFDRKRRLAMFWINDAEELPWYENGSPLLAVLHWAMDSKDLHVVHAGAVGGPEGGVLLAGDGGAGKSTTAFASLNSGLQYASDDHCLLSLNPTPSAWSLYNSGKLDFGDSQRFPLLESARNREHQQGQRKDLYFFHRVFPHRIAKVVPVRAVVLPHVVGSGKTTLVPTKPIQAFRALAPSSLFLIQGALRSPSAFRAMAELVQRVPCFRLHLGKDVSPVGDLLRKLIPRPEL